MKLLTKGAAALGVGLVLFVGFNWTKIQRLYTVQTLFDADKIVYNFSHMDAAFLHQKLETGAIPYTWPETPKPLPEHVNVNGTPRDLSDLLAKLETTAFIVIQDGKILNETYFLGTGKDDLRISWSMAKSFMSGLYGKALAEGQIKSLDDTVETYVASVKGSAYESVTLRQVLNMASGVKFNEDYMDPKSDINKMGRVLGLGHSMDEFAVGLTERQSEPGKSWQYVSIDTHIAAMVLRAATGQSLHDLFNETYGANLGFGKAPYYLTDGENVAFALGGLNMRTRDYAKFGQLFLQNGEWQEKQVIPSDWVAASTQHTAPGMSDQEAGQGVGYGYQWWVPMPQTGAHAGDYFAVGIYGQYIYVNPAANLVIAKNAANRGFMEPLEDMGDPMGVNIQIFRSLADYYSQESE